jgi:hypothetical protein
MSVTFFMYYVAFFGFPDATGSWIKSDENIIIIIITMAS